MAKRRRKRTIPEIRLAGDPILTTVCFPVDDNEDIGHIVYAMKETVKRNDKCVGISANQLGFDKRIIAIRPDLSKPNNITFMINPIIKNESMVEDSFIEGCLSHPGKQKEISRPVEIKLDYQALSGKLIYDAELEGFIARVVQHEYDHINGKCRVSE